MTVPQSLLVVALAVAWLIVLVPSSSRRRNRVAETVEGSGFRVLRRQPPTVRRMVRRTAQSEDQMTSQQVDVEHQQADDDTVVLDAVEPVTDDSEQLELTEAQTAQPTLSGSSPYVAADDSAESESEDHDEAELRRQYQAWRESTRPAAPPAPEDEAEPDNVRPIPRRPGRGTYDPEAAERARAYKFAKRRRTMLMLVVLFVACTVAAVLVTPTLWIGSGVSAVLLVLFMAYLRRQVKIEADIRERRLAKLQRARQIRPETPRTAEQFADPYAQRAPRPHPAPGPVSHRVTRVVVEVDDDDPGFDHLEKYEPMEYRRAVGQ